MSEIDLTDEQLFILRKILHTHLPLSTKVWLFGSRSTGKAKPYSDIDLAIDVGQSLSLDILAKLASEFEDSILPYKVDIVDWHAIDDTFREIIKRDAKRII